MIALSLIGLLAACSEGTPTRPTGERKPVLSLVQTSARAVDVRIAGPVGLRALQARVTWDAAVLRVTKVEPGRESKRIDRIFFNDPNKASGSLVFGLTDTRQVLLPARGALVSLQILPVDASLSSASLRIEDALGAESNIESGSEEGARAVPIDPVSAEVRLR